jgi:hypothetical protein
MAQKWYQKATVQAALAVAVIGGIVTIIVTVISTGSGQDVPRSSVQQNRSASTVEVPSGPFATFEPIPNIDDVVRSFSLPTGKNSLTLRFIAPNLKIDFGFTVDSQLRVGALKRALLEHFTLVSRP